MIATKNQAKEEKKKRRGKPRRECMMTICALGLQLLALTLPLAGAVRHMPKSIHSEDTTSLRLDHFSLQELKVCVSVDLRAL